MATDTGRADEFRSKLCSQFNRRAGSRREATCALIVIAVEDRDAPARSSIADVQCASLPRGARASAGDRLGVAIRTGAEGMTVRKSSGAAAAWPLIEADQLRLARKESETLKPYCSTIRSTTPSSTSLKNCMP